MRSVVEVNSRRVGENFTEELTIQLFLLYLLLLVCCLYTCCCIFFELNAPVFSKVHYVHFFSALVLSPH